jgi:glucose-6-phosphate 1-dehydrogenase
MSRAAPSTADPLVFVGAAGDLAFKTIFPPLQAVAKREPLDVAVVGVAKAGWGPEPMGSAAALGSSRPAGAAVLRRKQPIHRSRIPCR